MKILAVSDIHGMIAAVRRLVQIELGVIDAVVVAGDIGGFVSGKWRRPAQDVLEVLAAFEVPILYVYGNWDHDEPYDRNYGALCHHLHMQPQRIGNVNFVGFSGCPTHWGKNPSARGCNDDKEIFRMNVEALATEIDEPERTIVITHDKISHASKHLPNVPMFLYGHRHRFEDRTFRGARFVDVAALDKPVTYVRKQLLSNRAESKDFVRNVNFGTYVIIDFGVGNADSCSHILDAKVTCECLYSDVDLTDWVQWEGVLDMNATWFHED